MAKKIGFNTKNNVIINKLNVRPPYRVRLDIQKWINAVKQAEGLSKDKRALYDIFHDVRTTDGHLNSIISKRIKPVKNMQFVFTVDNQPVNEINDLIGKPFFKQLLEFIAEAKFYGHSLIELEWYGDKFKTYLIPRKHVKPHKGIVTVNDSDQTGIEYKENPYVIEIGDKDDLGLLAVASYFAILKRGNYGDWADYGEVYGQPFVQGTYEDDSTADVLEKTFEAAGFKRYTIAPSDAKIIYNEASSATGAETYKAFKDAMNTELSTLILGQSMTTSEASYGGYAQGKVHKDVEASIIVNDIDETIAELNEQLIPILEKLGFKVNGGKFAVLNEDNLDLTKRITVDTQLNNIIPISEDYFYETYGVTRPDVKQAAKKTPKAEEKKMSFNTEVLYDEKKNLFKKFLDFFFENKVTELSENYKPIENCTVCGKNHFVELAYNNDNEVDKYLKEFFDNPNSDNIPTELFFSYANQFNNAIKEGFKTSPEYDEKRELSLSFLRNNVFAFSAAKSLKQNREIARLITDETGKIKPFNQFKNDVSGITKLFNKTWLGAEYNNAVAQSQMAEKWIEIQDLKSNLPFLEYRTAGDDRVRDSHQALNNFKAPVDDAVWNTIYPPNDWGCRCSVVQTDNGKGSVEGKNVGTLPKLTVTNNLFKNNVGKTLQIFSNEHEYYNGTPNVFKLDAVKNYGMKNYSRMKATLDEFPNRPNNIKSTKDYDSFWNSMFEKFGKGNRFIVKSKIGGYVSFTDEFKKHITLKNEEERYKYSNVIEEMVTDADEVWFNKKRKTSQYCYLKYYSDNIYALIVDGSLNATTLHTVDKEGSFINYRKGILLYKNKNRL